MSKKVGKRLRSILYHRRLTAEMRKRWEEDYGVYGGSPGANYSLYDITNHKQRLKLDEVIEKITGKWCDEGIAYLTNEQLIEILEQVLKSMAKERAKKLETEMAVMIA